VIKPGRRERAIKNIAPGVQPVNALCWQPLADLIEIVDSGSLRAAAKRLGVSVNTVRARLARLEEAERKPIVIRTSDGVRLTPAGTDLYQKALKMRHARIEGDAEPDGDVLIEPGRVTIACTEGLGTGWLTPRIGDLKRRLPDLTIDLQFDYDLQRDRSRKADVGLTFSPPTNAELIVTKLATLHFMLFASPGYLREHGTPRTMDDLLDHHFVEQVTPGYNSAVLDLFLGSDRSKRAVTVQTNSVVTQLWAAASGAGIALLPSYTRAITPLLVPLPVLPQLRFPLSGFYHAEAKSSPAVRGVIDWLRDAFDTSRYPWFADRFVHPDDFPDAMAGEGNVVELYERMANQVAGVSLRDIP
jgi:DNA-binding transcriptional LysR family regulator